MRRLEDGDGVALSKSNLMLALVVGAAAFAVDQASKLYVTDIMQLALGQSQRIIDGFVTFVHTHNYGINFGWFQFPPDDLRPRYALIGLSIIVSLGLLIWAMRRWDDRIFATAIGLVVGGALGNAFDRWTIGAVTDFLNVTCCGINNPFAFNIADVAIFAGVALLLIRTHGDDKRAATE